MLADVDEDAAAAAFNPAREEVLLPLRLLGLLERLPRLLGLFDPPLLLLRPPPIPPIPLPMLPPTLPPPKLSRRGLFPSRSPRADLRDDARRCGGRGGVLALVARTGLVPLTSARPLFDVSLAEEDRLIGLLLAAPSADECLMGLLLLFLAVGLDLGGKGSLPSAPEVATAAAAAADLLGPVPALRRSIIALCRSDNWIPAEVSPFGLALAADRIALSFRSSSSSSSSAVLIPAASSREPRLLLRLRRP